MLDMIGEFNMQLLIALWYVIVLFLSASDGFQAFADGSTSLVKKCIMDKYMSVASSEITRRQRGLFPARGPEVCTSRVLLHR